MTIEGVVLRVQSREFRFRAADKEALITASPH